MSQARINVLNRLLAVHSRSLPIYMHYAPPWMHRGNDQAAEVVRHVARDQERMVGRLTDVVLSAGGAPDTGEFPMEFTALHDLSLDYLIETSIRGQREIIAVIQQSDAESTGEPLIREALGLAKGHLESLEELVVETQSAD